MLNFKESMGMIKEQLKHNGQGGDDYNLWESKINLKLQ